MRKSTTLSLILAAALGCTTLAFAGGPGGPGFGGQHHGFHAQDGAFRGLNLTDAQKSQIKSIVQQSFASLKSQGQAVHQARQAFEALSPNASGYQAAAASLAQAEASFTQARIVARAAVTAQTSAQQTQYTSNKAAAQARRQEWQEFKASHPLPSTSSSAQ